MKINNPSFRTIAAVLLVASIVWGYWWMTWVFAILFLFIFPHYYEIVGAGIMYDALYGLALPQFYNFPYLYTLSGIVLFLIAFFLRKKLLVYDDV